LEERFDERIYKKEPAHRQIRNSVASGCWKVEPQSAMVTEHTIVPTVLTRLDEPTQTKEEPLRLFSQPSNHDVRTQNLCRYDSLDIRGLSRTRATRALNRSHRPAMSRIIDTSWSLPRGLDWLTSVYNPKTLPLLGFPLVPPKGGFPPPTLFPSTFPVPS
jgi:hypothetical protein